MMAVGLIGIARCVLHRPLTHVTMLEASHLALGEGAMESVIAPDRNPDRRIGRRDTAAIENVRSRRRVRRVLRRIARGEAGEALGVGVLVAVDQRRCNLLAHAFEEGANLGQTEVSGVAVEVRDIPVTIERRVKRLRRSDV